MGLEGKVEGWAGTKTLIESLWQKGERFKNTFESFYFKGNFKSKLPY